MHAGSWEWGKIDAHRQTLKKKKYFTTVNAEQCAKILQWLQRETIQSVPLWSCTLKEIPIIPLFTPTVAATSRNVSVYHIYHVLLAATDMHFLVNLSVRELIALPISASSPSSYLYHLPTQQPFPTLSPHCFFSFFLLSFLVKGPVAFIQTAADDKNSMAGEKQFRL